MSLAGYRADNPVVDFVVLHGPVELTPANLASRLLTFEYLDEPRSKPQVTIKFDNSDGLVLGMATLAIGLRLRITFGYPGLMSRPLDVTISKLNAVPVRSMDTESPAPAEWGIVTMVGHPDRLKLNWKPRDLATSTFQNMTLPEAVRQIARDSGFLDNQIFVQTGSVAGGNEDVRFSEIVINEHETVEAFLNRMAARCGFRHWTRHNEFHWHQDGWQGLPIETVEYFAGPDLLEFSIDGDYSMHIGKVTAKSACDRTRRGYKQDASGSGAVADLIDDRLVKNDVMLSTPERMTTDAARRLYATASRKWLIRTTLVGNPKIMRNVGVMLNNFGPFIDGMWNTISVRHVVDNLGYTTDLGLRKPPGRGAPKGIITEGYNQRPDGTGGKAVLHGGMPPSKTKKGRQPNLAPNRKGQSASKGLLNPRTPQRMKWAGSIKPTR